MERILQIIFEREADRTFDDASASLERSIFAFEKDEILDVLTKIGVIPERIVRDSSEEKLFSKASDLILAPFLNDAASR